jgi:hypothetical protein
MKEPLFKTGDIVFFDVDRSSYSVDHITNVGGTSSERFYVFKLRGRYAFGWAFLPPAITHTFPESYVKDHFTLQTDKK